MWGSVQLSSWPEPFVSNLLTRFFIWQPNSIAFVALTGHRSPTDFPAPDVIDEYLYLHDPPMRHVPTAGREYLRLILWLNNVEVGGGGSPQPADGQSVEVVIKDVVYLPEPGAGLLQLVGVATLALLSLWRRTRED